MVVIYRPYLATILEIAAHAAGLELRRPATIATFTQHADGVRVVDSEGREQDCDLLVGAEGVHSPIRHALFGSEVAARYVGQMSLRWLVRDMPPGQAGFYRAQAGVVVVGLMPESMTYVAAGVALPKRAVGQVEARQLLRGVLAGFDAPYLVALRDRLDENEQQTIIARPYETVRLPGDWHQGRVLVIGDAAHATTPNLSSGGGMALEDGVVLAQELDRNSDIAAALGAFAARRRPRAELVVDTSLKLMALESASAPEAVTTPLRMVAMATLARPY
jgi:2-polyprenyl-6-methoxyphenol hydroxylase-like FAD-dependent oxidoreductase